MIRRAREEDLDRSTPAATAQPLHSIRRKSACGAPRTTSRRDDGKREENEEEEAKFKEGNDEECQRCRNPLGQSPSSPERAYSTLPRIVEKLIKEDRRVAKLVY